MIAYCKEILWKRKGDRGNALRERQNRTEDIALSGIDVSNEYKSPYTQQEIWSTELELFGTNYFKILFKELFYIFL